MNDDKILSYLTDLSAHNDREWFRAHKAEYEEANARFEALVGIAPPSGRYGRGPAPPRTERIDV